MLMAMGCIPQKPLKRDTATQTGCVKVKGQEMSLCLGGLHCVYNIHPPLWCSSRSLTMASNMSLTLQNRIHTKSFTAYTTVL